MRSDTNKDERVVNILLEKKSNDYLVSMFNNSKDI